jgi:hypothetical protein
MTEIAANASVDPSASTLQPSTAERNIRKLVDVLVTLQGEASTEILRHEFEQASGLARQMFYSTLRLARQRGWIIRESTGKNVMFLTQVAIGRSPLLHPLEIFSEQWDVMS